MQFSTLLVASGFALLALAYVLYPLYRGRLAKNVSASPLPAKNAQSPSSDNEQAARLSLQEVELDYQLGNIAEADYRTLREQYMRRALVAMKSRYGGAPTGTGHHEGENEQDTEAIQNMQDEQDTGIDALIEEQVHKLREMHGGDGDDE
jgi:hypothetical protein